MTRRRIVWTRYQNDCVVSLNHNVPFFSCYLNLLKAIVICQYEARCFYRRTLDPITISNPKTSRDQYTLTGSLLVFMGGNNTKPTWLEKDERGNPVGGSSGKRAQSTERLEYSVSTGTITRAHHWGTYGHGSTQTGNAWMTAVFGCCHHLSTTFTCGPKWPPPVTLALPPLPHRYR